MQTEIRTASPLTITVTVPDALGAEAFYNVAAELWHQHDRQTRGTTPANPTAAAPAPPAATTTAPSTAPASVTQPNITQPNITTNCAPETAPESRPTPAAGAAIPQTPTMSPNTVAPTAPNVATPATPAPMSPTYPAAGQSTAPGYPSAPTAYTPSVAPAAPVVPAVQSVPTGSAAQTPLAGTPPTTQGTYTLDDIMCVAGALMDAGKNPMALMTKFGVQQLQALPPEQYPAFAAELRAMGGRI